MTSSQLSKTLWRRLVGRWVVVRNKFIAESFNKHITEVETTSMLILSGLLNFSCLGDGWVGVENEINAYLGF